MARYVAALNAKDLLGALDCFNEGAGYAGGWGRTFPETLPAPAAPAAFYRW